MNIYDHITLNESWHENVIWCLFDVYILIVHVKAQHWNGNEQQNNRKGTSIFPFAIFLIHWQLFLNIAMYFIMLIYMLISNNVKVKEHINIESF